MPGQPGCALWGEFPSAGVWSFGGEAALSVEARYLEPELPDELQRAYAQTFERLRRMFRARGCTPEEAADLAQEAAVRAYVHVRRWGVNGTGLDPLLNRIARNLLIDRYRRTTPHIVPLDDAGELHDPSQDPTEEVFRRQRTRAVRSAIHTLPVRHQTAITYSLNGLTPEEVGRQMGIGRNAADALLHRARRSLKERLETVGEGMFGIALGFRLRLQSLARRAGLESGGGDAVAAAFANSAIGIAAAAVVAAIAVTGGGGPGGGAFGSTHGIAPLAAHNASDVSSIASGTTSAPAAVAGGMGSSGGQTYQFGPTQTTFGPKGIDTTTNVGPKGPNGEPFIKGTGYLHGRGTEEPREGDPGVLIARAACDAAPILCEDPGDG